MKAYIYTYHIKWGAGDGVVVAPDKDTALEMIIKEDEYYFPKKSEIELTEIDMSVPFIQSMSWC